MTDRQPVHTKNLDRYGDPPLPAPVAPARGPRPDRSERDAHLLPGDGPPRRAPAFLRGRGPVARRRSLLRRSGPGTQKSRDLAANPAATVSVHLYGIDLVFEGAATRVIGHPETLERIASVYREGGMAGGGRG